MNLRISGVLIASLAVYGATAPARTGPSANDAEIESTIKMKLARSKIGANHFKVRVQNGIVYWDGTTDVAQHKGAATRMAKSAGAKRVVNNIQVSSAGRAKARANLSADRRTVHAPRSDGPGEGRSEPRSAVVQR